MEGPSKWVHAFSLLQSTLIKDYRLLLYYAIIPKNTYIFFCLQSTNFNYRYDYIGTVAGILWPCGIITFLGEIFGSESKAQVYGMLHGFLCGNQDSTADLRKIF